MARNEAIQGHGKKRPAQGDPDGAQPLTKRFGHLRIDNNMPFSARAKQPIQHSQLNRQQHHIEPSTSTDLGDAMWLDDTTHTTYIHDLDQELMEADSPGLVFSPLVAKVLSVPQAVLSDSKPSGKELVLYTEPSSLTVPRERDHVRKAILESRARARARVAAPAESKESNQSNVSLYTEEGTADGDPMEIDG